MLLLIGSCRSVWRKSLTHSWVELQTCWPFRKVILGTRLRSWLSLVPDLTFTFPIWRSLYLALKKTTAWWKLCSVENTQSRLIGLLSFLFVFLSLSNCVRAGLHWLVLRLLFAALSSDVGRWLCASLLSPLQKSKDCRKKTNVQEHFAIFEISRIWKMLSRQMITGSGIAGQREQETSRQWVSLLTLPLDVSQGAVPWRRLLSAWAHSTYPTKRERFTKQVVRHYTSFLVWLPPYTTDHITRAGIRKPWTVVSPWSCFIIIDSRHLPRRLFFKPL